MQQEYRKIWGRKLSRPLKDYQKGLLKDHLPPLQITLKHTDPVDPFTIFPFKTECHLEIGFGGGEHLIARASESPMIGFIGCEPFINGVASLLKHIDEQKIDNIRIVMDDARLLLSSLPAASLSRIYILFPDPWPKKRHHKRRIVSLETMPELSRVLKSEGALYLATDIIEYAEGMQETLRLCPEFHLDMGDRQNLNQRPLDWPAPTKYERKGTAAGRAATYMIYRKK